MYKFNKKTLEFSIISLKNLSINILPNFRELISVWKSSLWVPTTKYLISYQRPKIWNVFLANEEKEMQSHSLFLSRSKSKLLDAENEWKYF